MATVNGLKADVSIVSPSSKRLEELWVVCGFMSKKLSYAIGGNMVTRKIVNCVRKTVLKDV